MIRTLVHLIPDRNRGELTSFAVLTVISVLLRAASCILLVPLVAGLFADEPSDALPALAALTATTVVAWIVDTVVARKGFALGFSLLDSSQHSVADRLTRVPMRWFTTDNTTAVRQAIATGGPDVVGLVVNLLTPIVSALLLPCAIAIGLFTVSWQLGIAALIAVPILLAALWASARIVKAADAADSKNHNESTERVLEFAKSQPALRASRRADPERGEAGRALAVQRHGALRLLLLQIPGQVLFGIASQIALVLLAGTAAVLTLRDVVTAPEAVALIVVAVRFLEPFTVLAEFAPAVERTNSTLAGLRAVLEAPVTDESEPAVGKPNVSGAPRIEFEDVTFGYSEDDGAEVLSGVSFTIDPGSTTAIVGSSGSGKSTILALIAGLETPRSGRILVDGTDLATLSVSARRALSSMVFQQPYLFGGGIGENVRTGDPDADDAAVDRAIRLARVDEIVGRLPDGLNSVVGEAGTALSGGERQRVSIARAILKPARVLLVDEATSALDFENEAAITRAIADDPLERTRVLVAHRLSALRYADTVLFVADGRLIEQGGVDELRSRDGAFAEFWRHQEQSSRWRLRDELADAT